eukprot:3710798-Lingulodinium_polyedra.AAC.1
MVAMDRVAALALKERKCKIVPCWKKFSINVIDVLRCWLAARLPQWAGFQICAHAEYLGFTMGTDAGGL